MSDIKRDNRKLENDVSELKKQLMYMETYSRRENRKFFGLPENSNTLDSSNGMEEESSRQSGTSENAREVGGDFNLVCDVERDKRGGAPTTHWKSREEVSLLKEQFQLADIWRIQNPEVMRFTWERTNPEIRCRLDFFLISESLCPNVLEAEIHPGYRTDNRMITVKINTTTNPRGPGFWKLNSIFFNRMRVRRTN